MSRVDLSSFLDRIQGVYTRTIHEELKASVRSFKAGIMNRDSFLNTISTLVGPDSQAFMIIIELSDYETTEVHQPEPPPPGVMKQIHDSIRELMAAHGTPSDGPPELPFEAQFLRAYTAILSKPPAPARTAVAPAKRARESDDAHSAEHKRRLIIDDDDDDSTFSEASPPQGPPVNNARLYSHTASKPSAHGASLLQTTLRQSSRQSASPGRLGFKRAERHAATSNDTPKRAPGPPPAIEPKRVKAGVPTAHAHAHSTSTRKPPSNNIPSAGSVFKVPAAYSRAMPASLLPPRSASAARKAPATPTRTPPVSAWSPPAAAAPPSGGSLQLKIRRPSITPSPKGKDAPEDVPKMPYPDLARRELALYRRARRRGCGRGEGSGEVRQPGGSPRSGRSRGSGVLSKSALSRPRFRAPVDDTDTGPFALSPPRHARDHSPTRGSHLSLHAPAATAKGVPSPRGRRFDDVSLPLEQAPTASSARDPYPAPAHTHAHAHTHTHAHAPPPPHAPACTPSPSAPPSPAMSPRAPAHARGTGKSPLAPPPPPPRRSPLHVSASPSASQSASASAAPRGMGMPAPVVPPPLGAPVATASPPSSCSMILASWGVPIPASTAPLGPPSTAAAPFAPPSTAAAPILSAGQLLGMLGLPSGLDLLLPPPPTPTHFLPPDTAALRAPAPPLLSPAAVPGAPVLPGPQALFPPEFMVPPFEVPHGLPSLVPPVPPGGQPAPLQYVTATTAPTATTTATATATATATTTGLATKAGPGGEAKDTGRPPPETTPPTLGTHAQITPSPMIQPTPASSPSASLPTHTAPPGLPPSPSPSSLPSSSPSSLPSPSPSSLPPASPSSLPSPSPSLLPSSSPSSLPPASLSPAPAPSAASSPAGTPQSAPSDACSSPAPRPSFSPASTASNLLLALLERPLTAHDARLRELNVQQLERLEGMMPHVQAVLKEKRDLEEEERSLCVICQDAPRQAAPIPCGHFSYCRACIATLKECAICREPIVSIVNLHT